MSHTPRFALRWLAPALACLFVLSLLAPATTYAQETGSSTAVTTAPLNMRSGPGVSDPVLTVIPSGTTVAVTGAAQSGFLPVSWNAISGWSSADYLDVPSAGTPSESGTAKTVAPLNVRSGPGTAYGVISVIPDGTTVSLTGESANGFISVSYDGYEGWVSADYVTTGTAAPVPAPDPAPAIGTATVTTALHLRSGPGTSNTSLTVMPAGAMVSITGSAQNGYIPVTYDGVSGWAYAEFLDTGGNSGEPEGPAPEAPAASSMVTTAYLNMRSAPDLSGTVLTVIPAGSSVSISGSGQNGFLPVSFAGLSGWASANFLQEGSSASPAPQPGSGGSGIMWPVSGGTWSVIQGYNGGSHQNRSASAQYYYSLDIARTDGNTAGQAVYAPASGTILWVDPGSGGIAIDMGNGYVIAMFHCTFDAGLGRGQSVQQGQYLGTVSGPGGAGYASTPHVDMTLWQSSDGGRRRSAAPFTGGNAISGMAFPDVGGWKQHGGATFNH